MTATNQKTFSMKDPMVIDIEQHNRVCILRCKGRFVAGPEMDYMQTRMGDIKQLGCAKVLADFQDVTSLGSLGVTFLVGVYASVVRKPGGRFVLVGASPHVKHVLDLTQLTTVIPQASNLASALAALATEDRAEANL
ncbi:MAG: STAS domain-containing protein [Bryobacteraceae bacterium]